MQESIADIWGDRIEISAHTPRIGRHYVQVEFKNDATYMDLTPRKARKLARKLKRAAKAIEQQ